MNPHEEPPQLKLLLLGSGESGKSTFFKRLLIKYGQGYEEDDRKEFVVSIHENTLESIKTLLEQSRIMGYESKLSDSISHAINVLDSVTIENEIDDELASYISTVWSDPIIKHVYDQRSAFQVPDSASFFFDNVHELGRREYVPSEEHILRCRDRTTGVTHEVIKIREGLNADFDIYDVGGQRSERRNWVRIFQNVKAVLFVVAISEYDQHCFEDGTTNRLDDALAVFKMVANTKHFEDTPIVLLFNKIDLFRQKVESGVPFRFEDYNGDQEYNAITDFIRTKFELQSTRNQVITRFVSALEPNFDFQDVFKVVVEHTKY